MAPFAAPPIGEAMIDASWAMASRGGGRFDPDFMVGATLPAYPAWVAGHSRSASSPAIRSATPTHSGSTPSSPPSSWRCWSRASCAQVGRAIAAALLGGAIGLTLTPVAPAGVPVIAASAAALIGLLPGDDHGGRDRHAEIEGDPVG